MLRSLAFAVLFSLLLLWPTLVLAQAPATPIESKDETLEKKAIDLLNTIAERVPNVHSSANRVWVECGVADLLWSRDEKKARAMFKSLTDEVAAAVANVDTSEGEWYNAVSQLNQQRHEIVTRIARHDTDLALAFLRATHYLTNDFPPNSNDWDAALELQLATQISSSDSGRALRVARKTLSHGLSYNLIQFLNQLQQKDKAAAATLYAEIVAQIKDGDLTANQRDFNFALNLLAAYKPPQADENTYRDLLPLLIKTALSVTTGDNASNQLAQGIYYQLKPLRPEIEKYFPAGSSSLQQWYQQVERSLDPGARMYMELNEINQTKSTVDDVLALAPKYSAELRSQIYSQAVWKAMANGDVTRARQIANELISDPNQRRQLLEQINNQSLLTAVTGNRIAEARQRLNKITAVDQRTQILIQLANAAAAKNDKKEALNLLDEARTFLTTAPSSYAKIWAQIQVSQAYAAIDPPQSFSLIQPLVLKANELVAAAAVLDGFENRYLQDGEWLTSGGGQLNSLLNSLAQNLAQLARIDFDRARDLSSQLERPEIRLMADLQIAQSILDSNATAVRITSKIRRID